MRSLPHARVSAKAAASWIRPLLQRLARRGHPAPFPLPSRLLEARSRLVQLLLALTSTAQFSKLVGAIKLLCFTVASPELQQALSAMTVAVAAAGEKDAAE